jgi:hypothetical protein
VETREKERKRAEVETSRKTKKKKNSKIFRFDGKEYKTYSAMVDAKREFNWIWLEKSGVQEAAQHLKKAKTGQQFATFRQQEHTPSGHDTDATTNSPNKLSMTLRPRRTSKLFRQQKGTNNANETGTTLPCISPYACVSFCFLPPFDVPFSILLL